MTTRILTSQRGGRGLQGGGTVLLQTSPQDAQTAMELRICVPGEASEALRGVGIAGARVGFDEGQTLEVVGGRRAGRRGLRSEPDDPLPVARLACKLGPLVKVAPRMRGLFSKR